MCVQKNLLALGRATEGSSSNEYVLLLTLLGLAGAGGFTALGFGMQDSIVGAGGGAASTAAMTGAMPGVGPSAQAGLVEDAMEDLRDKGLEDTDIDELVALGVDLKHVEDYSREDFEAFGVDPEVIDKIMGVQTGGGNTPPPPNPSPINEPDPGLSDNELPDPSDIDPNELLEGTGAEFSIGELDENAQLADKCFGVEDPRARYACLAEANGIEPPSSYEMGGTGCFGEEFGTCLKDGWHKFSTAFGDSMKGIWNFITNPDEAIGALWTAVRNPVGTVKSVWNYYKDACTTDGYTCAGTIGADLVFSLGAGLTGRVLHGAKLDLVRRFPKVGNVPGFRLAARRLEYGPFASGKFKKGLAQAADGSGIEGFGSRFKATRQVRKVMVGDGTLFGRWKAARRMLDEKNGVIARHVAEQARRGRATLVPSHFEKAVRTDKALTVSKLDDVSFGVATGPLDDYVKRSPLSRADRALRDVARNADGTFTLSDKVKTIRVSDSAVHLTLDATDQAAAALEKYKGPGLSVTRDGDVLSVSLPSLYSAPSWGGWHTTAWADGLLMGLPVGVTGSFVRHADEQNQKLEAFYRAVEAQQQGGN